MNRVFIIAEAGVNHNGDIGLAKKLIDVASSAGADAVKFQTFKAEKIVSKNSKKADYQKDSTDENESQFEMLKKLELSEGDHRELIDYCSEKNIVFMSTPFDIESVNFLDRLGLMTFKIPSGEITNYPLLKRIGELKKKIILSTGMSTIGEVESALGVLMHAGTEKNNITVLHANTEYPTPVEDVNLKAMSTIGRTFNLNYGYSDHTLGIEIPIAAAALGATVIEKHFTLDKKMKGPDHMASLEPEELCQMVKSIRNIELALGDGIKKISVSESRNKKIVRKSIVASKKISKGELFTEENITTKRPATGINPMQWEDIIGMAAQRDYCEGDLI